MNGKDDVDVNDQCKDVKKKPQCKDIETILDQCTSQLEKETTVQGH